MAIRKPRSASRKNPQSPIIRVTNQKTGDILYVGRERRVEDRRKGERRLPADAVKIEVISRRRRMTAHERDRTQIETLWMEGGGEAPTVILEPKEQVKLASFRNKSVIGNKELTSSERRTLRAIAKIHGIKA